MAGKIYNLGVVPEEFDQIGIAPVIRPVNRIPGGMMGHDENRLSRLFAMRLLQNRGKEFSGFPGRVGAVKRAVFGAQADKGEAFDLLMHIRGFLADVPGEILPGFPGGKTVPVIVVAHDQNLLRRSAAELVAHDFPIIRVNMGIAVVGDVAAVNQDVDLRLMQAGERFL